MDYRYPPDTLPFRMEVRQWLQHNLDEELRGLSNRGALNPEQLDALRRWNRKLADAGYAAISWPAEYGGRAAGVMEQVVLAEEMHRAEAPAALNPIGLANIAPSIMAWGTEEQKRTLLPRMQRGDDIWCQGFSEPGAGSDLASLRCRAVLDGDHFIVNGQKVWNTLGHLADYCELLVRTDPDAPKHQGITCLLVDMHLPGITVKPLTTLTGEDEFSEIFFEDVRAPTSALLGPVNQGWQVAMTTLSNERAGVANLHLGVRKKIARLIQAAREREVDGLPVSRDPIARQQLARVYLYGEYQKALADVCIAGELNGRPPGAESSITKQSWSDIEQLIGETSASVLGAEAQRGDWGDNRLYSRATSIAGGTTQINKNIIARRVLGLPKD
ncbi:MAG: acyl-CoA dehydrogenase family protein [Haliea sp.]|jgi:alkylation response protein AidB-like acyl-CoA dehydrogenase|nr:acyl-CoA dehydrogenase family protein [Haliea sp.]